MKRCFSILLYCLFLTLVTLTSTTYAQGAAARAERRAGEAEAKMVIDRFTGGTMKVKVSLSLSKTAEGQDVYQYALRHGVLHIAASNPVAACRGFYDFAKSGKGSLCSWSGSRFSAPQVGDTCSPLVVSPYRYHQYFNVVTYGYSAPFWDEERWDRELDWMALHGIDMPLLLLAQEQMYREVFLDMGLAESEIDAWEVGPAHLPWMRMGNLSGNTFDGPLGSDWNRRQVELCRHVIGRMRRLGMTPICPAFGGFVPKEFVNHYDGTVDTTGWDWVPQSTRNYRLNPGSKAFAEVGTRFIRKWEQKFGKCRFYLSDSFNEMAIPQDTALMTAYGDAIYSSLREANPDAVWVMQGWTIGYQRYAWGNGIFEALVKNVPDDRFLMLDMATDYNRTFWQSSYNWDFYEGFYGKPWVWSVIPNMGGKTAYTGVMDYYANGRLDAQHSPNRGNLVGYGIAAEGIENNEMLYELISDAGWMAATDSLDLECWMEDYFACRYGSAFGNTGTGSAWKHALLHSVYQGFRDHPQFGWQVRNNIVGRGSVQLNESYYEGVELLVADRDIRRMVQQGREGNFLQADLIEAVAMYVGGRIEEINGHIGGALEAGNKDFANELLEGLKRLMLHLDRSLTAHPLHNLERWEGQAMKVAATDADKRRNAVNARRIVSVWYGNHTKDEPVNDYACRIWAGLVRDYYLPRLAGTWEQRINGKPFDQIAFENRFVESAPYLSSQPALAAEEVMDYLADLVLEAKSLAERK